MKRIIGLFFVFVFAFSVLAAEGKEDFADFNGQKVYYKSFGKGQKALVFVHCWTCNEQFWKSSVPDFSEYRIITLDLIGHGKSDKPKTDYTMNYFAQSVAAVLKKARVKKAVLVGHSMGTPVIRQFYRLYPQQTEGLVIVDGALRPFGTKTQREQFFAPLRANYAAVAPAFIEGMLGGVEQTLKNFIKTSMAATPDYVALSAMDGMSEEAIYQPDKIEVPVLAILADSSFGQQKDLEQFLRSFIPQLELRMWSGVSHFLHLEKPQEFNRELKAFMKKNKLL